MPPVLKRFLLSLFVAGLTFWMSLETVFTVHRGILVGSPSTSAGSTRIFILRQVGRSIEAWRKQQGRLPKDLQEVQQNYGGAFLKDAWGRELVYQRNGMSFSLVSYGRDGKPGGVGLNADIVYGEKKTKNAPTFWQFLTYPETGFLRMACIGAACFTFFVAMYAGDKDAREGKKAGSVETLFSIGLMVGISVIGAVLMGALEYPSGH